MVRVRQGNEYWTRIDLAILSSIRDKPKTIYQICVDSGLVWHTVRVHLWELERQGVVECHREPWSIGLHKDKWTIKCEVK